MKFLSKLALLPMLCCTVLPAAADQSSYYNQQTSTSMQNLVKYFQYFGGYLGYDVTKDPNDEKNQIRQSLIDVNAEQLAQLSLFNTYLGAIPVNAFSSALSLFVPTGTPVAVINNLANTSFSSYNSPSSQAGGIIIMYTLLVSTMNTAHEGQMLGQKWSSIWVPIRSTVGLALLIPKASGYCLMQVFFMWIVVQGVGAADKIWDAALSYLNRGGVIVQAQQSIKPQDLISGGPIGEIATGATNILAGQVCMLGLQKQLENRRQFLLDSKAKDSGDCNKTSPGTMQDFCNTPVPDFLGSVNAVAFQNDKKEDKSWTLPMPNFPKSTAPYNQLNGICGSIQWKSLTSSGPLSSLSNPTSGNNQNVGSSSTSWKAGWDISKGQAGWQFGPQSQGAQISLTPAEVSVTQMSRAIAIQQMYMDLTALTRVIVNNDPQITKSNGTNNKIFNNVATQQFGVPFTQSGSQCQSYSNKCVIWGPLSGGSIGGGSLLNGNEFLNAINDYNGVMMPTLNLINLITKSVNMSNTTAFIREASTRGWIMAGSYFFDLVLIQGGSSLTNSNQVDTDSGLSSSTFEPAAMLSGFPNDPKSTDCSKAQDTKYAALCTWFAGKQTAVSQVQSLIAGQQSPPPSENSNTLIPKPTISSNLNIVESYNSSTVYGLINNSMMMQLPGQPGISKLNFANTINIKPDTTLYTLSAQQFSCGTVKILFFSFCLGQLLGNLFYNVIFLTLYNILMTVIGQLIQQIVFSFLMVPLTGMMDIFKQGIATLSHSS